MNKTSIEWTDSTWSPLRVRVRLDAAEIARAKGYISLVPIAEKMAGRVGPHCEHVSPGCENCYAATNNHRCLPANGTGLPYDRRSRDLVEPFVDEKILLQPLGWKAPRKIFVENQSDIFGEWYTDEMLDRMFAVMALCPQHTFQILTKRPERMHKYISDTAIRGFGLGSDVITRIADRADKPPVEIRRRWPLRNVWTGVSAENQKAADERIPLLLQTKAAVRFISAEPLLGQISIERWVWPMCWHWDAKFRTAELAKAAGAYAERKPQGLVGSGARFLNWVICGGESGPDARPMHPDWARSLRDQCQAAGVPFFMKQMGSVFGPNKGHALPDDLNIRQFPEVK